MQFLFAPLAGDLFTHRMQVSIHPRTMPPIVGQRGIDLFEREGRIAARDLLGRQPQLQVIGQDRLDPDAGTLHADVEGRQYLKVAVQGRAVDRIGRAALATHLSPGSPFRLHLGLAIAGSSLAGVGRHGGIQRTQRFQHTCGSIAFTRW